MQKIYTLLPSPTKIKDSLNQVDQLKADIVCPYTIKTKKAQYHDTFVRNVISSNLKSIGPIDRNFSWHDENGGFVYINK